MCGGASTEGMCIVCMCARVCVCVHVFVYVCTCVCMCARVCVCNTVLMSVFKRKQVDAYSRLHLCTSYSLVYMFKVFRGIHTQNTDRTGRETNYGQIRTSAQKKV